MSSSVITLSESAMKRNWQFMRSYFGEQINISAVVKGNAYGHGIAEYVPLLENCNVNHFSVYSSGEAYEVNKVASPDSTIMIMGAMGAPDVVWAVEEGVEFFVFDMHRLHEAITASVMCGRKALIHIEVETGMYRTGFDEQQIAGLIKLLKEQAAHITLKGVCMHFAGAESISNHLRLKQQQTIFKRVLKRFKTAGMEPEYVHTCCSAAAIRFPSMRYNLLRIGILQYGFWPSQEILVEYMNKPGKDGTPILRPDSLERVIRWESTVMSIKDVPAGAFVGYGYSFLAQQNMRIAIVPVGYGYGFSRSLSNTGFVLIQGYRVPVVGIVNMNCLAVDITMLNGVDTGDEVVMIGKQGDAEISVASFGEMTNLLNYELLTRLPAHIPRLVERE